MLLLSCLVLCGTHPTTFLLTAEVEETFRGRWHRGLATDGQMKSNHIASQGAATADIRPYTNQFFGGCSDEVSTRKAENR
jgi:hypothetical protein